MSAERVRPGKVRDRGVSRGTSVADLVALAQEAAFDSRLWPEFLLRLSGRIGGEAPAVFLATYPEDRTVFSFSSGIDPKWARAYDTHYIAFDLRRPKIQSLAEGVSFRGDRLVPDSELLRSTFYNEFLKPQGFFQIAGCVPWKRDGHLAVLRLLRSRKDPRFGSEELRILRTLAPHVGYALRVALLRDEQSLSGALSVVEALRTPAFLLGPGGKALGWNPAAEKLLAAGRPVRIGHGGILLPADPRGCDAFAKLLSDALGRGGTTPVAGTMTLEDGRSWPFDVLVVPVPDGVFVREDRRPAALVFVSDPSRKIRIAPRRLARHLGVTLAEAAVVSDLVAGLSLEVSARRQGISPHTARTHLKRALQKTESKRQVDLVRRVLASPALFSVLEEAED
ncbi:MAG: transcriptional regulator [Candidatus Binatia bacterium]|nr:MAG: transcriptional regulator [Candidatus Binatia bacterium]